MNRTRYALRLGVAVATVLAAPIAATACEDSAACLREIQRAQRQVRSLSASFVQTKNLALLEEPIRSTGLFAFRRPDDVLWRIDDPAFEMRVEGGRVQVPAGEQDAMRSIPPGLQSLLDGMSAMFTGDIEAASRRFEIDAAKVDEGIAVRMTPKQAADRRLIANLRLTFAGPELALRRVELEESVGDRLEIVFRDIHRNDAAAEAAFAAH